MSKGGIQGDGRGQTCHWCKRQLQATGSTALTAATRDHLYPAHAGGNYRVWCCHACNGLKGGMYPNEWRAFMAKNPEWWKLAKHRPRPPKLDPGLPLPSPERSSEARKLARRIVENNGRVQEPRP